MSDLSVEEKFPDQHSLRGGVGGCVYGEGVGNWQVVTWGPVCRGLPEGQEAGIKCWVPRAEQGWWDLGKGRPTEMTVSKGLRLALPSLATVCRGGGGKREKEPNPPSSTFPPLLGGNEGRGLTPNQATISMTVLTFKI